MAMGRKRTAPPGQGADLKVPHGTSLNSFRSAGVHPVSDETLDSFELLAQEFARHPEAIDAYVDAILIRDADPVYKHRIELGHYYRSLSEDVLRYRFSKYNADPATPPPTDQAPTEAPIVADDASTAPSSGLQLSPVEQPPAVDLNPAAQPASPVVAPTSPPPAQRPPTNTQTPAPPSALVYFIEDSPDVFYTPAMDDIPTANSFSILCDDEDETEKTEDAEMLEDRAATPRTIRIGHRGSQSTPKRRPNRKHGDPKHLEKLAQRPTKRTVEDVAARVQGAPTPVTILEQMIAEPVATFAMLSQNPDAAHMAVHAHVLWREISKTTAGPMRLAALSRMVNSAPTPNKDAVSVVRALVPDEAQRMLLTDTAAFDLFVLMYIPDLYFNDDFFAAWTGAPPRRTRLHNDWADESLIQLIQLEPFRNALNGREIAPYFMRVIQQFHETVASRNAQVSSSSDGLQAPRPLTLKVTSLNVNGVNDRSKLQHILCTFALQSAVTFLQETKFNNAHVSATARHKWAKLVLGTGVWFESPPCYAASNNQHSCRGVVTMVHPDAPISDLVHIHDHAAPPLDNRYVLARGTYHGKTVYLHNVYAPSAPEERAAFFAAFPTGFEPGAAHILSAGTLTSPCLAQPMVWLHALRLVDVYRQDNPTTISYTSPNLVNRLDYIFVSEELYAVAPIKSTHIHADTGSDHSACSFELSTHVKQRTGPWRTPRWLTRLPEAAAIVHERLDEFFDNVSIGPAVASSYDSMIHDMRTQLRQLHRDRVDADTAPRHALELELKVALEDLSRHPCRAIISAILDIKRRLTEYHNQVREHKADAAVQRHLVEAAR
ncbi:hypothetical protein ACHHYP_10412 [Achlya hypogyna]|uniref:Endonuclease/exonuclease/phosphatase domain-containing protein n=1 Tax=Achlya hypogyna TaxID=1202772 RepID=A0A1V9YLH2_ACHHY|nr:hypothetical protein ACHHYP_10412 [Achlya hypogyna]